jgi:hypothetical protein
MNLRVGLFDLQLLKYVYVNTPYPSTAGLLLAGYHKAENDQVILLDKIPNFNLYDIVYIIKDDWDLYHEAEWLRYDKVVLVGRYWDSSISTWKPEWTEALPDMTPYRKWAELWLERYPSYKAERIDHFWYTPVLLKTNKRILNPEGEKILLIDYRLDSIDADYSTLMSLNIKSLQMLHALNVTNNTRYAFQFLKQKNIVKRGLWLTIDTNITQTAMLDIIQAWKEFKLGRMARIKLWITAKDDVEWKEELYYIINLLALWREQAGKRLFIEPVDLYSYSYPDILIALRRWTGRDMGYAYNSLIDYLIYDSIKDNKSIIDFFIDPYEYISNKRLGWKKMQSLVTFIEEQPELTQLLSTPVKGKGV